MKTLYSLLLSVLFSLTSVSSIGQAEMTLITELEADQEVIFVDDEFILSQPYSGMLEVREKSTNEIVEAQEWVYWTHRQVEGDSYFFFHNHSSQTSSVKRYEGGEFTEVQNFEDTYFERLLWPTDIQEPGIVGGVVDSGLVVLDLFQNGHTTLDLQGQAEGWLSVEQELFVFTDSLLFNVDYTNYSLNSEYIFPEGYKAFGNITFESEILLRKPVEGGYSFALYDVISEEVNIIQNSNGEQLIMRGASTTSSGKHVAVTWTHQVHLDGNYTRPQGIGYLNLETAVGYKVDPLYDVDQRPCEAPIISTSEGLLAFGLYSYAGAEPYLLTPDSLEVLMDIYPGLGASAELRIGNFQIYESVNPFEYYTMDIIKQDSVVYFVANHPKLGREIWVTDGTSEGTFPISDHFDGPEGMGDVQFAKGSNGEVYAKIAAIRGSSYLYKLPSELSEITIPENDESLWEVSFGSNDAQFISSGNSGLTEPDVYSAYDGSAAILYSGVSTNSDWLAYNHEDLINGTDEFVYEFSILHVVDESGKDLEMHAVKSRSRLVFMGRDYEDGSMVLSFPSHTDGVFYDDDLIGDQESGYHLLGLDKTGQMIWDELYDLSGVRIFKVEYNESGIYLLGDFSSEIDFGHGIRAEASSSLKEVFVAHLSRTGEPKWVSTFPSPNTSFGNGVFQLTYDSLTNLVYAIQGATSTSVSSTCGYSDWSAQIVGFDAISGGLKWSTDIFSDDVFELSALKPTRRGNVWIIGNTRGNLTLQEYELPKTDNYLECSKNGFYTILDGETGSLIKLRSDEPEKVKLPQEVLVREDGVYILSLVFYDEPYNYPIGNFNSNYRVQLDTRSFDGRLLSTQEISAGMSRWYWSPYREIRKAQLDMDFHPSGDIFVSGQNLQNGLLGEVSSRMSQTPHRTSLLLQRRSAPEIDLSFADEVLDENDEQFLFPNPVNTGQYVNLLLRESDLEKFENLIFYDNTGRQAFSYQLADDLLEQRVRIPNDLSDGLYVVRLEGKELKTMKLIVRRW